MTSKGSSLAKLTRPRLHGVVRRERVLGKLADACARPLVWVTGPPGCGKTVAVASFIEANLIRSIWFQIDPGDHDLSSFFYYLRLGAETFRGRRKVPLPLLTPEYLADVPSFARHFFRVLFSRMQPPAAIVLDDYHELRPDSPLHGLLELALSQAPDGINVIVVGRAEPPAACSRIDAGDRMSILNFDTLRLDLAEAREIASRRHDVDAAMLQQLHEHCDGWIAGFALMLERLKRSGRQGEMSGIEVRASTFDYFASQILQRIDPRLKEFLLRTALLPHMSADMAASVSACEDAGELLEDLYRRRFFTERRGEVYRYHDLFREFLQERLLRERSGRERDRLLGRAAAALGSAGRVEDAFKLWCEARDWEACRRLILEHAPALLAQGRGSLLREWTEAMPTGIAATDPWIAYWVGVSLMELRPDQGRRLLESAYAGMKAASHADGQGLAAAAYVLSFINDLASLRQVDPWIDVLSQIVDRGRGFLSPVAEAQACAALLFALTHRRPESALLEAVEARTLDILSLPLPPGLKLATVQALIIYYAQSCRTEAGISLQALVAKTIDLDTVSPFARSMFLVLSAFFHYSSGDIGTSNAECMQALAIVNANGISVPVAHVIPLAGRATNEAQFGSVEMARNLLDAALAQLDRSLAPLHSVVLNAEYMLACTRASWGDALRFAQTSHALAQKGGWVWGQFLGNNACALALAALGRHAEAAQHLGVAGTLIAGNGLCRWRGLLRLTQAQVAMSRNDRVECIEALREGLSWMREDGARLLVQLPGGSPSLLGVALAAGIETAHVRALIRRFGIRPPAGYDGEWPWPVEIRTLGGFEIRRYGEPMTYERKAPKRALQLLKALVAFGSRDVAQERLADALWPQASGDEGINALNTTLSRLRNLLEEPDAVIQSGGCLTINPALCHVDACAFEHAVDAAGAITSLDAALEYYRGSFLDHDQDAPWAVGMRERLRRKFVLAVRSHAESRELGGDEEGAIRMYLRGIDADGLAEEFYRGLMRCQANLGRRAEAMSTFRQLRRTLSVTLGIEPSKESQRLFASLQQEEPTTVGASRTT